MPRSLPVPVLLAALGLYLAGCGRRTVAVWPNGVLRLEGGGTFGAEQGRWTFRYRDGQVREQGRYEGGRRVGHWVQWFPNGQRASEGERGWSEASGASERQGPWLHWHENGTLRARGSYVDGRREGAWEFWTSQGAPDPALSGLYRDGTRIGASPGAEQGR